MTLALCELAPSSLLPQAPQVPISQLPQKSLKISCRRIANVTPENYSDHLTREIDMNTLYLNIRRPVRRLAAITIVAALALSFAVIVTLGAEPNVTVGGILASLGDYITEVGEALGSG